MSKVKEPTASELVSQKLDDIRTAELAGGRIAAAQVQGDAEINAALAAFREALDEQVLQRPDSEERVKAATERVSAARAQRAAQDELAASAYRVIQTKKVELEWERRKHLAELSADAEATMAAVAEARESLTAAGRRYMAAYAEPERMYRALGPAIRAKTEEADSELGQFRSGESIEKDLRIPACPVTDELLRRINNTDPRPAAAAEGYVGDAFSSEPALAGDTVHVPSGPDGEYMFDGSDAAE